MTFFHGSLIALGSTLVAIPVILHLVMRRRPKHAEFPALRFVTATLIQNQRKLQLRHWALLALRCFAVAAAALALARPLLSAGTSGSAWLLGGSLLVWLLLVATALLVWWRGVSRWLTVGFAFLVALSAVGLLAMVGSVALGGSSWLPHDQEAPVAAVFVVDDSPRMAYRDHNETRLAVAQRAALALLPQLPTGSDLAVLSTSAESASFSVDASAAAAAIRGLEISLLTRSIPDTLATCRAMLASQKQRSRQEIYIFSDLTQVAWNGIESAGRTSDRPMSEGSDRDADRPEGPAEQETRVYLIDVGVADPRNIRLGLPQLPDVVPTAGAPLPIQIDAAMVGAAEEVELEAELWLEDPPTERPVLLDGKPQLPRQRLRDRQRITLSGDAAQPLQFELRGLEPGVHHGRIQVTASDPLPVDNDRYFTVATAPPDRILLASGPGAAPQFLAEALAPYELRVASRARFESELITTDDLPDYALDSFAAVLLIDPPPLEDRVWQKLASFVEHGGGLAIVLGRNAVPIDAFNSPAALQLLPGRLARQWRAGSQPLLLQWNSTSHPMLAPFAALADSIPWDQSPVFRHWVLEDLSPTAVTILEFRNQKPALLETHRGKGTCLTWTTSLSDPLNVPGRPPWNLLPTSEAPWPFVMLADQMASYVIGRERPRWNFTTGESAVVPTPGLIDGSRVQVFTPAGAWETTLSKDGQIALGRLRENGVYRIVLSEGDVPATGISANLAVAATNLARISPNDLDSMLGKGDYQLIAADGDFVREVSASRVGQEGYPWAVIALALLLAAEHVLGNRFYR